MRGKGYGWIDLEDSEGWIVSRKTNANQREEILANYIRRRSGRRFTVPALAKLLGVSDRTIQKHLAGLEQKGWIKRTSSFNALGKQNGNVIDYTGPKDRLTGNELTVESCTIPTTKRNLKTKTIISGVNCFHFEIEYFGVKY